MEVRGFLATLCALHWEHEEIELILVVARAFNEVFVDNAAAGWVLEASIAALLEERLHDALVDDHKTDLGLGGSLVVDALASIDKLADFTVNDLIALSPADTIAEDDDVGGVLAVVAFGEVLNGLLQAVLQLRVDDFLTLLLDDEVTEVLGHLLVGRGSETND